MISFLKNKIKAFTLSEVLITIVVIGIVAAITVPVVVASYNEYEKVAKIRKTYTTLNNALSLAVVLGGDNIFNVEANDFNTVKTYFDNYLKDRLSVTKVCYNKKGCWNSGDTKYLKGGNVYYNRTGIGIGADIITAVLADGTFINVDVYGSASIWTYFGTRVQNNGLVIFFDINGEREPNVVGKDIFAVIHTQKGLVPVYHNKTAAQVKSDCSPTGTGYSCIKNYLRK